MSSTSVLICTADHNVALLGPDSCPGQEQPALHSHPSSSPAPNAPHAPSVLTHLRTLLQQLDDVGWDRAALSADLTSVTLRLVDAGGRHHSAALHLSAGFPIAPPTVALPLPTPFKLRWLPGDSLATLVSQLEKVRVSARGRATAARHCVHPPQHTRHLGAPTLQTLEAFQPLWEQLEDLDSNTQLLDPVAALAKPYSHCSRCIALGNGASCQLKLSPAAPRALPSSVVFHGPGSVVAALQNSWYSSAHKLWQEAQSVRENLQAVLQVRLLPQRLQSRRLLCMPAKGHSSDMHAGGQVPVRMHAKYVPELRPYSASHPCLLCRSPCRPPSLAPSRAVLLSWLQLEARITNWHPRKGPPARQGQGTTQTL